MKRVSKREMMMRFPEGQPVRAQVLRVGKRVARVLVDGVECVLPFPPTARDTLLGHDRVNATVSSTPSPMNRGWFAPGTVPPDRRVVGNGLSAVRPTLRFDEPEQAEARVSLDTYIRTHPVGSIVWAVVLRRTRSSAKLQLIGGPETTLEPGACHDHTAGEPLRRLPLPEPGQRLRVVIREYRHSKPLGSHVEVKVSLHSFQRDQGFCNQEAGYKSNFNIERSHFAYLPWARPMA